LLNSLDISTRSSKTLLCVINLVSRGLHVRLLGITELINFQSSFGLSFRSWISCS